LPDWPAHEGEFRWTCAAAEKDVEPSEAIRVSGLLRVVLSDEAVRDRLRQRPDWRVGLRKSLIRLKDPFPSDVDVLIFWPNDSAASRELAPVIHRLGRIAATDLNVGGLEMHVKDGQLMHFEGSELVSVIAQDLLPRGIAMTQAYPIMPGAIALTIFVPADASAAEWRERLASCWADIQLVREAQRRAWRSSAIGLTRRHLIEATSELGHDDDRDPTLLLDLVRTLEERLKELEGAPQVRTRVRADLPFREMVWLRKFLGEGRTGLDIAVEWEDQVSAWDTGVGSGGTDPVLAAARDEWVSTSRKKSAPRVDASTVERSLKRWLGKTLGSNRRVRAD